MTVNGPRTLALKARPTAITSGKRNTGPDLPVDRELMPVKYSGMQVEGRSVNSSNSEEILSDVLSHSRHLCVANILPQRRVTAIPSFAPGAGSWLTKLRLTVQNLPSSATRAQGRWCYRAPGAPATLRAFIVEPSAHRPIMTLVLTEICGRYPC